MESALNAIKYKVSTVMEGEEISLLFQQVKTDIAAQIIRTKPNDAEKRDELYYIAQGIDYLERKMTEYANEIKEIE